MWKKIENALTKDEFVKLIAEETTFPYSDVLRVVNSYSNVTKKVLSQGKGIVMIDFGMFLPKFRNSRQARNVQTGEKINVPAKYIPYFKPSKSFIDMLKEKLNVPK